MQNKYIPVDLVGKKLKKIIQSSVIQRGFTVYKYNSQFILFAFEIV